MCSAIAHDILRLEIKGFLRDAHGQAVGTRAFYPRLHGIGRRRRRRKIPGRPGECRRRAADQLFQCAVFDFHIGLSPDFLCGDQVITRLRFVGVGDGGVADLEIALGLRQLLADRGLLGLGER